MNATPTYFQTRYIQRTLNFCLIIVTALMFVGCGKSMHKLLKNPDPAFKLRKAEQFFVKKQYNKAQQVYEDIMPYYKTAKEFEDIYYKYGYCAYYQGDYLNAENIFKTYIELYPNSPKAEELDYMRAYTFYMQSPKPSLDQTETIKAMGLMQTFINTHPGSAKNKEATEIIDICRKKLETKDRNSAILYYDLGQFRAAAVSFTTLLNNYPDSELSDEYQFMVIKSYFRFAELSVEEKKVERFEQVVNAYREFMDRYPDSKYKTDAESFLKLAQTNIKYYSNEQVKAPA